MPSAISSVPLLWRHPEGGSQHSTAKCSALELDGVPLVGVPRELERGSWGIRGGLIVLGDVPAPWDKSDDLAPRRTIGEVKGVRVAHRTDFWFGQVVFLASGKLDAAVAVALWAVLDAHRNARLCLEPTFDDRVGAVRREVLRFTLRVEGAG